MQTQLFEPLGLAHTSYCGTADVLRGRVRGYSHTKSGFVNARPVDMSQGFAAGGVCSTVEDLLRWQNALHHGGVISSRAYQQMTAHDEGRSYGLGIGIGSNRGHRVLFHAGGISGFDAMMTEYPDDDVAIVVLANAGGDTTAEIESRVARAVLGIPDAVPKPLTSDETAAFIGSYRTTQGFDIRIAERDGKLCADTGDTPAMLTYLGDGVFLSGDGPELIAIRGASLVMTYYGATRFEATRR